MVRRCAPQPSDVHVTLDGAVCWGTALHASRPRDRFPVGSSRFFIDWILLTALWPRERLSLWRKGVPACPLGNKDGRCAGMTTLPSSCADCLRNSGSLSLLESYGPAQACNAIALHLFTNYVPGLLTSCHDKITPTGALPSACAIMLFYILDGQMFLQLQRVHPREYAMWLAPSPPPRK